MAASILSLREINRATLARQMLLERAALPITAVIEKLVGLQAQLAVAPFVGLWSRLHDFQREDLARLIEQRRVIKASLMRATLHLFTADDYIHFRSTLDPALAQAADAIIDQRGSSIDADRVLSVGREYIREKPRTFAELSDMLAEAFPGKDVGAMRYTVRTHLPLVQVPVPGGWSYPAKPEFTLAEDWIGREISPEDHLRDLVFRYLAAFGPASPADMQTWSGIGKLKDVFESLRSELVAYRDENRRELFDLPGQALPGGDAPAPGRFMPEFDNLLLSHSIRTRIIAKEYHPRVFLPGLRVAPTILVDGFVSGVWKVEKSKTSAELIIEPFIPLNTAQRSELAGEAERLVRFIVVEAKTYNVRFVD